MDADGWTRRSSDVMITYSYTLHEAVTLTRSGPGWFRVMYSTSQRERILAEFEASGLSLHAFSRESGVSRVTLQTWVYRNRPSCHG